MRNLVFWAEPEGQVLPSLSISHCRRHISENLNVARALRIVSEWYLLKHRWPVP